MTNKRFNVVVYGGGALLIVGVLCLGFWLDGPPCIRDASAKVIGGYISSTGGMFASETAYRLWYTGKRKGTGEYCETQRRVTEVEYNRRMYDKE